MNRPRPRSTLMVVLTAVAAVLAGLVTPAAAAAPYCGITWGSLAEVGTGTDSEVLTGVRAGRHDCFDRLVIDLNGQDISFRSYDVRYVGRVVEDGSGRVVPLRGGADLQIVVRAPAHDQYGNPTYTPGNRAELVDVGGWTTFRQVAWAGSFEGQTTVGLGVRARLPFRVLTLDGVPRSGEGPRLVIDVAHRW
ncbi:hypothetical protein [Modestobacter sp. I12A-02662]|uniref:AMIN-like domain-containing (lipo)protein n=1 Tax=Modestobacter sp. I12A-02662 TaxID=1730496 RepID=UPI0034DF09F4